MGLVDAWLTRRYINSIASNNAQQEPDTMTSRFLSPDDRLAILHPTPRTPERIARDVAIGELSMKQRREDVLADLEAEQDADDFAVEMNDAFAWDRFVARSAA